jgi:hypothetical protein
LIRAILSLTALYNYPKPVSDEGQCISITPLSATSSSWKMNTK